MKTQLIIALGTAAWIISANAAVSEEVATGTNAEASQTATTDGGTEGTGDAGVDETPTTRRADTLGNNEWRRNDSGGRAGRPSDGRPGGRSGGSGSDGGESGGGGGGGAVD